MGSVLLVIILFCFLNIGVHLYFYNREQVENDVLRRWGKEASFSDKKIEAQQKIIEELLDTMERAKKVRKSAYECGQWEKALDVNYVLNESLRKYRPGE